MPEACPGGEGDSDLRGIHDEQLEVAILVDRCMSLSPPSRGLQEPGQCGCCSTSPILKFRGYAGKDLPPEQPEQGVILGI